MPPFDGDVSESEVLSMFDKDGDLRDEPQSVEEDSAEEGQENQRQHLFALPRAYPGFFDLQRGAHKGFRAPLPARG